MLIYRYGMLPVKNPEPKLVATEVQRLVRLKYQTTPIPVVTPTEGTCARIWRTKIRPNWVLVVLVICLAIFVMYQAYQGWVERRERLANDAPVNCDDSEDTASGEFARKIFAMYRKNDYQITDTPEM